jgi:hypothetical protein
MMVVLGDFILFVLSVVAVDNHDDNLTMMLEMLML